MKDIVSMKFALEEGDIEPRLLSEYLALFEVCVVAAADLKIQWDGSDLVRDDVERRFRMVKPLKWNEYFERSASDLISIRSVNKNSPLELVVACSMGLLVVAVILSGGKIRASLKGVEATLPPLGDGIKSLKGALGFGGKIEAGYSIKTKTIKLNADEVQALMAQDPAQRNKGGFQNFLIGLQSRLNKSTKRLTLSDVDLERILRYQSDPKKGGFQARFKKIFGRHFATE